MGFNKGENNINAKLTTEEADLLCELWEYRKKRIFAIDCDIEKLKKERIKLKNDISRRQLAFKFEVTERTVTNIISGTHY